MAENKPLKKDIARAQEEARRRQYEIDQARAIERARLQEQEKYEGSKESKQKSKERREAFFSTKINYWVILLLAIVIDFYHWYSNFKVDVVFLGITAFTLIVFFMYGFRSGSKLAFLSFAVFMDLILPALLIFFGSWILPGAFANLGAYLIIVPWWTVFAIFAKYKYGIQSKMADLLVVVGILVGLFLLSPYILTGPTDIIVNQAMIQQLSTAASERFSAGAKAVTNKWDIWKCQTETGLSETECTKKILGKEALAISVDVSELETTEFELSFKQIPENTVILRNEMPAQINVRNGLKKPVSLLFTCGLIERGAGTAEPKQIEIEPSSLLTTKSIMCNGLDTTKKGTTPTFYVNATATGLFSTGYKKFIVVGKETKETILEKYQNLPEYEGLTENSILLKSSEFGVALTERSKTLKPIVGAKDLIQAIVQEGTLTYSKTQGSILYGVDEEERIPLAIFIKNNGKGRIIRVTGITITPPEGFKLDQENCGLNDVIKTINWRKITPDKEDPSVIAGCYLIPTGKLKTPNNLEEKLITIKVNYDYIVSTSKEITIAEQITP